MPSLSSPHLSQCPTIAEGSQGTPGSALEDTPTQTWERPWAQSAASRTNMCRKGKGQFCAFVGWLLRLGRWVTTLITDITDIFIPWRCCSESLHTLKTYGVWPQSLSLVCKHQSHMKLTILKGTSIFIVISCRTRNCGSEQCRESTAEYMKDT